MSGICAIVHFDGSPIPEGAARKMAATTPFRSRDGTGAWANPTIQLVHQATQITPEPPGPQPMHTADGRHVLVATARLDQRDSLLRSLPGNRPEASDEALLLASYEKWGPRCVEHLYGDFAFAVVDTVSHEVLLAVDPLGIRSLYYRIETGKRLILGTEALQVLAAPGVPVKPFEPAVAAHLAGPYGRPEWSFYDGVVQLAPGHLVRIGPTGSARVERCWDPTPDITIRYRDEREYAEHFREIFFEVVRDRRRSLGPLGVQLSGGMDSGSVASTVGRIDEADVESKRAVRTYSYAFHELVDCDERKVSDLIVREFGFESVPIVADQLWPLVHYPEHGPVRDDPFVLVYTALGDALRRKAHSDGVRLLLVAERGDDVIGTPWVVDYRRLLRAGQLGRLWQEVRLHGASTTDSFGSFLLRDLLRPVGGELKARARKRSRPQPASYPPWIRSDFAASAGLEETIASSELADLAGADSSEARFRRIFSLTGRRWATDLERRHARAGLGYSDPFADRRIVEYVLAIPQSVVNRPGDDSKRLLRAAMNGVMPTAALNGARKVVPQGLFDRGLRQRARSTVIGFVNDMRAADMGWVDQDAARKSLGVLAGEPGDLSFDPWWLLTLEWWLRQHW
jgi:asparagine synthase (glutamine-hydrolysing)